DWWALRHAWGTVGERVAVAVGVAALVVGAAVALVPWLHVLLARAAGWRVAAALLAAPLVGWPLGATATAQRALGAAAPIVASLAAPVVASLVAPIVASLAVATLLVALSFASRIRVAAAACGVAALLVQLWLPSRLYPSLR